MNLQKKDLSEKILEEQLRRLGRLRMTTFEPGTFREVLNLEALTLPNLRNSALELVLAKKLEHENLFNKKKVLLASDAALAELSLRFDAKLLSLDRLIAQGCLNTQHLKFIMFQLFSLANYLHFNGIVARNFCPSNLLISGSAHVHFGDFSSARFVRARSKGTLEPRLDINYAAPELSLNLNTNFCASDVWSLGCLFFEMIERRPLFRVNYSADLLRSVLRCLGSPIGDAQLDFVSSPGTVKWIKAQPYSPPTSASAWMKPESGDPLLRDLLDRCLRLNPSERISAAEALSHPFFAELYDAEEESQALRNHLDALLLSMLFSEDSSRKRVQEILLRELVQ